SSTFFILSISRKSTESDLSACLSLCCKIEFHYQVVMPTNYKTVQTFDRMRADKKHDSSR
ncbi:MAG: hypothetical protein QOA56_10170, partial [Nitrososphaeraceae archaeon]|nr:hypothetical protein [Nitrososphaeraceae archaeon]